MPTSVDDFLKRLAEIDLMPQAEIEAVLDGLPGLDRSQDANALAQEFVRQKKLSRFQAQAVYQGRTRGLVLGNYVLLDKIGVGGMGQVYKAEHRRMRRVVAIKVLPPHIVKSPDTLRRFQREVEAAAQLEHPNIVTAHDADEFQGVHYLVMQYVEGSDLSRIVRKQGPFPMAKAIELAMQIGKGLQYAHHKGIVHRDIKPANALVDVHGAVKILDMGLARFEHSVAPAVPEAASQPAASSDLTMTGSVEGTVDYMAPEQAMDAAKSDPRSDIYSLGCTLHFLLTGQPVYDGENVIQKLIAHREAPPPALTNVPPELNATFQRMIAKRPDERHQKMEETMRDLQRCLQAAQAWAKSRPQAGPVGSQGRSPRGRAPAAQKGMDETLVLTGVSFGSAHLRQLLNEDLSISAAKLSVKKVTDGDLAELAGLSNLQALDLEGTAVSDAGLAHLAGLSNLRRLDLSGTSVTDAGLRQLQSFESLRRLFLTDTAVTDAGLPHVARFTRLDRLSLRGTDVSDSGLVHLSKLRRLVNLDLSHTQITDAGLAHLKSLSALEEIDLSGTRVTSDGVGALGRLLPKAEIVL